jgi:hypothetical protein
MTGLTFTITPPHANDPWPFTIKPSRYKITQTFLGHQKLEFEHFKSGSRRVERRSRVVVTSSLDTTKPPFLGWVAQYTQPNPDSNKPQRCLCYSYSKDLEWRYPFLRTYTAGQNLQTILNHTPASEGLLYMANSLSPDIWDEWLDGGYAAGLNIYSLQAGINTARVYNPTIYLGTTLLNHGTDYDPYSLNVNEWCQDDTFTFIRTAGANPYTYPCYIIDYKNAYLKRHASAPSVTLSPGSESIYPSQETEYSLLKRIMRSTGMEYEFLNNADGYQYLNWGTECSRGGSGYPGDPGVFCYEEDTCGYGYTVLYDWEWTILDPEVYGFDLISLRGKNDVSTRVGLTNPFAVQRHWKEDIRRDSSMQYYQVNNEAEFLMNHNMREDALNLWAPEDHSILPGDWVWCYIDTSPWDNEYLGRVIEKTMEDDVMKLTLGLFTGDPWW